MDSGDVHFKAQRIGEVFKDAVYGTVLVALVNVWPSVHLAFHRRLPGENLVWPAGGHGVVPRISLPLAGEVRSGQVRLSWPALLHDSFTCDSLLVGPASVPKSAQEEVFF